MSSPSGALLPILVALSGCSNNDPVPACEACEQWFRISPILGRYPSPHPIDSSFVLFSTVEKADSTAIDAARQDDEDIWLTWIEDLENEDNNAVVGRTLFAITDDDFSTTGTNTSPRWSPSGTQILFVHSPAPGGRQLWRMDIDVPTSPGDVPVLGTPVLVVDDASDPAWYTEDRVLFTRDDKLFRIDISAGAGTEEQLSFNPPDFSSNDRYIDRHPNVAPDGGAVFRTEDRLPVGDIYVEAFEVGPGGSVETDAFILFQSPAAEQPTFPVIESGAALRTPHLLKSIPIDSQGPFKIGANLAATVVEDSTRESYCDTTIVIETVLQPDAVDTLTIDFEIVRGTLQFVTEATNPPNAQVFWTRQDGRESINDFGGTIALDRCQTRNYDCLLPWAVNNAEEVQVGVPETFVISATSGTRTENRQVTLSPGDTTVVVLFADPGDPCPAPEPGTGQRVRASIAPTRSGLATPAGSSSILRAEGDASNVWRLDFDAGDQPLFQELLASDGLIQSPAITREFSGGVRYVAWVSDETGDWKLYVRRLENWVVDGPLLQVALPGSFDNLACTRNVFHPYWVADSAPGALRAMVTMTECPDNEFPDIGFDEDPWPIGELRIWTVLIEDYQ